MNDSSLVAIVEFASYARNFQGHCGANPFSHPVRAGAGGWACKLDRMELALLNRPSVVQLHKNFPELYEAKVHNLFHRSPLMISILSTPPHPLFPSAILICTHFSIFLMVSFWLYHQCLTCISFLPIRSTCHAHLVLLDFLRTGRRPLKAVY
jgi:hypothetical protein